MTKDPSRIARKSLNRDKRRSLKAAIVKTFIEQYARRAQKGIEPNDRRYDREVERHIKRMKPEALDQLMRDDEE